MIYSIPRVAPTGGVGCFLVEHVGGLFARSDLQETDLQETDLQEADLQDGTCRRSLRSLRPTRGTRD